MTEEQVLISQNNYKEILKSFEWNRMFVQNVFIAGIIRQQIIPGTPKTFS